MPIIRSLRTRRAERERAAKHAIEARAAAEQEAKLKQLEEENESRSSVASADYVNQSDEEDFQLDPSIEMTLSPDGVPILRRRPPTLGQRVRYFLSLSLGVIIVLDVFVFLFLVPFVLAPSIASMLAQFNDTAVLCVTTKVERLTGLTNCSEWSSCRNGCTMPALNCTRVTVNYKQVEDAEERRLAEGRLIMDASRIGWSRWQQRDARLFVNNEGCGYLPFVNCSSFNETYGVEGKAFWCHYSERNKNRTILHYSFDENLFTLVACSAVPLFLLVSSGLILSCLHCHRGDANTTGGGASADKSSLTGPPCDTDADSVVTTPIHSVSATVDKSPDANTESTRTIHSFGKRRVNDSTASSAKKSANSRRIEVMTSSNDDDDVLPRLPKPFKLPAIVPNSNAKSYS